MQFIVDGYIKKGGYCLGALFFNLPRWSNINLPIYCLKMDFHCRVIFVRAHARKFYARK